MFARWYVATTGVTVKLSLMRMLADISLMLNDEPIFLNASNDVRH
jgi:hypothetical protein